MPCPPAADGEGMNPNPRPDGSRAYQNIVLTAIAGLLALGLLERAPARGSALEAPAVAQASEQPEGGGLTNALEQRKQIIAELRTANGRLERIETRLKGRLEAKVTDMPPLRMPPEAKPGKPGDQGEPRPAPGK
jgi:hypothetical protein